MKRKKNKVRREGNKYLNYFFEMDVFEIYLFIFSFDLSFLRKILNY